MQTVDGDRTVVLHIKGHEVFVSARDIPLVVGIPWYIRQCRSTSYVESGRKRPDGSWGVLSMHRLLMGEPEGLEVDHRNRDGLDNTRGNLREATHPQNIMNSPARAESGYKGVDLHRRKWRARGRWDGHTRTIATFDNAEDAARAYDDWATATYGEYAWLNFPDATRRSA